MNPPARPVADALLDCQGCVILTRAAPLNPSNQGITMTLLGERDLRNGDGAHESQPTSPRHEALHKCVRAAVRQYLQDMGDHQPEDLYSLVLSQVEKPMIEEVLRWAHGNQCRSALALGISRGTLRKKIKDQGIS